MPYPSQDIEAAAKEHCDWLIEKSGALAVVILAFTIGAAWALGETEMIELARAQNEARGRAQQ